MRDINSFTVSGNITRQPEITQLPSSTDMVKLRVAVNTRRKQGDDWVDKASYLRAPSERCVAGSQKNEMVKIRAAQAQRGGWGPNLHRQQPARPAAGAARPIA